MMKNLRKVFMKQIDKELKLTKTNRLHQIGLLLGFFHLGFLTP
jgi:hypothetical protein